MTITAFEAAKKICDLSGWNITNLKLQKMLYISHLYYLGNKGEALISEEFEAWLYGPVLPSLYHKTKEFADRPVGNIFSNLASYNDNEELKFIEETYKKISNHSAWDLVLMTHLKGGAWEKNFDENEKHTKIPNADILEEYKKFYGI